MVTTTPEHLRLAEARAGKAPWLLWGPYLSERQWGTVREDYSAEGMAWDYLSHDNARSRAYRWGEDGLLGISDDRQRLCFALALWNGADAILKERLFGLTNNEGNHGEDVKEYYFYLDNTPTHSYMKALYKYPHRAYPYTELVEVNRQRKQTDPHAFEYELLDTGVFQENRYFDVVVEYAKQSPSDILICVTISNRGPEATTLHVLPTLWFRNTWSWAFSQPKPVLHQGAAPEPTVAVIEASHAELGDLRLYGDLPHEMLFVENETNARRLFGSAHSPAYPKDGINDYIVSGNTTVVNPQQTGTKAAAHYELHIAAGETQRVRLRLTSASDLTAPLGHDFDAILRQRLEEADAFYQAVAAPELSESQRAIQRQALAGTLWTKQFYYYILEAWLRGDPAQPSPPPQRLYGRNSKWLHFYADDVLTPPDKWEYPWGFATWDLAFQSPVLALVDPELAKHQLYLLAREWYMTPDGQLPAYEWAFGDVNPPVHAWAAWRVYQIEKRMHGCADREFLKRIFQRCLLNFTWWVNRKDAAGNNLFQGGFLGLDNIGVFDRNQLPPGAVLFQADGTSWMGFFALEMLQIALELASEDASYLDIAAKFFQHFIYIADAMNSISHLSAGAAHLWDEQTGFYYDVLCTGDGQYLPMQVQSLVGLLPLLPVLAIDLATLGGGENQPFWERVEWLLIEQTHRVVQVLSFNADAYQAFKERIEPQVRERPHRTTHLRPVHAEETLRVKDLLRQHVRSQRGRGERISADAQPEPAPILLSFVNEDRLRRILTRMLDENQFLSPYGIRSVSRGHLDHPYVLTVDGREFHLRYEPAESSSGLFGGNSNWRGPIWFPVNFILLESLEKFYRYFGDSFQIECPTGSGVRMNLGQVAAEIRRRLSRIFECDANGNRPVYGGTEVFQRDPHWKDHLLFFEYFHGDNGAGLGASHQTGWTGLIANLLLQQADEAHRTISLLS